MNKFIIILFFLLLIVGLPSFISAATTRIIDPDYNFAWSPNAGWINFAPTDSNGNYIGINITDSAVTGNAWSDNFGWIDFAPSNCSGKSNCGVKNTSTGILSGSAWNANVGWIDFAGVTIGSNGHFLHAANGNDIIGNIEFENCGTHCQVKEILILPSGGLGSSCSSNSDCGIYYCGTDGICGGVDAVCSTDDDCDIDNQCNSGICVSSIGILPPSSGVCGSSNGESFVTAPTTNLCSAGTATSVSGSGPWTWTCSGVNGGSSSSTCTATVTSNPITSSGGGGLLLPSGPNIPEGGFKIVINNGAPKTNNPVVTLAFNGGLDVVKIEISLNPDFSGASLEAYEPIKSFVLPTGDGLKIVYAKFIDKNGAASSIVSSSILLDTQAPSLAVVSSKKTFSDDEQVILNGTADPNSEILFSWDDKYASVTSQSDGSWSGNFGYFSPGNHLMDITIKDGAGNIKTEAVNISILSEQPAPPSTPGIPGTPTAPATSTTPINPKNPATMGSSRNNPSAAQSLINDIQNRISPLINYIFPKKQNPKPVISVPKETPQVLKHIWNLLPVKAQK